MGSWHSKELGKKEQPQLKNKRNEGSVRSRRRSETTEDEYTLKVIVKNVEEVRERSRSGSIKPEDFDKYLQRLASCAQDVNKLKTKKSETKEKAQKLISSVTNELITQKLKADPDLEHSDSSTSPKEETRIKISNTISFDEMKGQLEALKRNITEAEVNKDKNNIRPLSEWIETFRDIIKTQALPENQKQYLENELQRLYQKIKAMNQRWKAESGVPHSPGKGSNRSQSASGKNPAEGSNVNYQNERRELRPKGQDMALENKFKPVESYDYSSSTGSKITEQNFYSHQGPVPSTPEQKNRYKPHSFPDGKIAIDKNQVVEMPHFPNYDNNVNKLSTQKQKAETQKIWPKQANYSRELAILPTSEHNPPIPRPRSINSKPAEFYHADHLRDDKKHPDVGTKIEDKKRLEERPLNKTNIPETFTYGQPKRNAQVQGRQDPLYVGEEEKKSLKRELQNFDRKKDEEKGNRTNSDNRVKRMKNDEEDHEITLSPNTKEKKHFYNLDDQYSFPDKSEHSVPFGEWVHSTFDEYLNVRSLEYKKINENDEEKHMDVRFELKQKDITKVFDKHKLPRVSSPRQKVNNDIPQQPNRKENEDQHLAVASEVENSVYSNKNENCSKTTAEFEENHNHGLLGVQRIESSPSRQQNTHSVDQSVDEEPQEEQPSKTVKVYQSLENKTSPEIVKRNSEVQRKRPNDQIVSNKLKKAEDEPLKILDVHQYFRNDLDFKRLESLNYMDRINTIRDHAQTFESQVNSFDGEKCSLVFFVLNEKLMSLIGSLNKMQADAETTETKVEVVEYLKSLQEILKRRATGD